MTKSPLSLPLRILGAILIIGALTVAGYTVINSSDKVDTKKVFADRTLLSGLWNSYKQEYWEESTGRTLDKQQNDITTSEGQSYTMLRAVWQSDKPTFDKSWQWTKEQLQREDNLFSWKWGQKSDGTYGVLTEQNGQNTASDGDSDIALALVMATSRWQQNSYLDEAKKIIPSIWEEEVITVKGTPYLASNNLEKDSLKDAVINPSYFAPYAYRIFSKIDTKHDWTRLVDSSYDVINTSIDAKLDKSSTAGLVPDWVLMNKQTGELRAPTDLAGLTTNYSYDAMRTTWRLALDDQWYDEPRAVSTLKKMDFLTKQWQDSGKIFATYSHDGMPVTQNEPPESYGTAIGYFKVTNPEIAKEVYTKKLQSLYDANNNTWSQPMNYYSDNWTWFGIGLYNEMLPNLTEDTATN